MSNRSFIEALDEALALLEQGYPFEYCVRQFPEYEDRLRPLLQVGDDLRRVANTTNAALQKAQAEPDWERLLAGVPQQQVSYSDSLRSTLASFCRTYFGVTAQRYVMLAAMVVFVCITSLAGIFTTLRSRPGDALYALRPGAVQLVLAATHLDPSKQNELRITFAVDDINVLMQQDQPIPPETIDQVLGQVKAAIEAAEKSENYTEPSPQLIELQEQLEQLKQQREYVAVEGEIDDLQGKVAALVAPTDVAAAVPSDDSSVTAGQPGTAGGPGTVQGGAITLAPPTPSSTPAQTPSDESPPTLPTDDVAVGDNPTNTPSEPSATATEEPAQVPTDTTVPEPSATETPPATATETPTPTPEPSVTPEPTPTPSPTPEPSVTPEPTPSPTEAPTMTPEPSVTPEPTPTPSATPTGTVEAQGTATPSPSPTSTQPPTTPSATTTPTVSPTAPPTPGVDGSDADASQEASPPQETP